LNNPQNPRVVRNSIAVGVGCFLFLYFCFVAYYRILGPQDPKAISSWPMIWAVLFGGATIAAGSFYYFGTDYKSMGFGKALLAEGIVFTLLTLLVWFVAHV
jgi:hypothetical protein